jgi:hypothetical protein
MVGFSANTGRTITIKKPFVCSGTWNNDNFIDQSFRDSNPSDADIVCALFGSGV